MYQVSVATVIGVGVKSCTCSRCKDGRVLELQVDFPKGDPPNPMSWDESVAKFMSLAAPVYGEEKTAKLCGLIDNLEASADFAADLAECLA